MMRKIYFGIASLQHTLLLCFTTVLELLWMMRGIPACFSFKIFEYIEVDNIIGIEHLVPMVHETNFFGQITITSCSLVK